jgi:hypothetical protein
MRSTDAGGAPKRTMKAKKKIVRKTGLLNAISKPARRSLTTGSGPLKARTAGPLRMGHR